MIDVYEFDCDPENRESLIQVHYDFLVHLMHKRCQSLSATYLLPPVRYAGVLDPAKARQTEQTMLREWKLLLHAESLQAQGEALPPLAAMNWRLATVPRLAYVANERADWHHELLLLSCRKHGLDRKCAQRG